MGWFRRAGCCLVVGVWAGYWIVMNRPFQERARFPHSKYTHFPPRARPVPIAACAGASAATEFAFVSLLSTLWERVCFLDCFERYVKGAIVLARSIRRVTNLDMVLLVAGEARHQMSHTTRDSLVREGWILCAVDAIGGPVSAPASNRFILGLLYTKLTAWKLVEYTAVMTLDLDMLVMRDPTDIFTVQLPVMLAENKTLGAVIDRPGPGAVQSSKCGVQWTDAPVFNGGSLLIVPSMRTFHALVDGIRATPHDASLAEQGYLNSVYNATFYALPFAYNGNMRSILCEPHVWGDGDVRVLHFNVEKPWGFARMDLADEHRLVPYMLLWQSVLDRTS